MAKKNKKLLENELNRYGQEYELAKARGDKKGMDMAHAKANGVRKQAGWSYDNKRGYTVEGARIVNSKESLALAKSRGNAVRAARQVTEGTPIAERYTPAASQKKQKPKPKFSKPQAAKGTYQTKPQIQTSGAFSAPAPVYQNDPIVPKAGQTGRAFTPFDAKSDIPLKEGDLKGSIASAVRPAPVPTAPAVWQDMERERKRTEDAQHAARQLALEKLGWKYERQYEKDGKYNPWDMTPLREIENKVIKPVTYTVERGIQGAYGGVENILGAVSSIGNKGLAAVTSVGGLMPNPISKEYNRRADLAHKIRLNDIWKQSIEERYEPTQGMQKAGDISETIGNLTPALAVEILKALTSGGASVPGTIAQYAPKLGMALMALSSYGAGSHRAALEGADTDKAALYGALSAAGETVTESMFDFIPGLKSGGWLPAGAQKALEKSGAADAMARAVEKLGGTAAGRAAQSAGRALSNPILRTAGGILGEGVEEAAMAVADPYFQRATYDPNAKDATREQIAQDALMGVLVSGIMQGGSVAGRRVLRGRHSEQNHAYTAQKNQHIPDYEVQWNRFNRAGQLGVPFDKIVKVETNTPVDMETAYSAYVSGFNDFVERTTNIARRILAGNETNMTDIADTVVSPPARQMLEQGFGFKLSDDIPQAVRQVHTVANALHQKAMQDASEVVQIEDDGQKIDQQENTPPSVFAPPPSEMGAMGAVQESHDPSEMGAISAAQEGHAPKSKPGGVVQNETARTMDKKTLKAVHSIAERLGVQVEFVDDMEEAGSYADGKIRINTKENDLTKTDRVIRQVFVHELTHTLEDSGEYGALFDAILSEVDEAGALDDVRQILRERYAEHGQELDDSSIDREVVAWFAEENLFTDERAINNLARRKLGLFQRIRDWLHGLRVRLTGTQEEKFVWQAEQLYKKAFDALESGKPQTLAVSENRQKNNAPSGTQYRFSDHKIPTYDELMAKPDIQVVDIRGRGVGRIAEQRKQFLNSPEAQKLYEAPVINRDTGEPVFITPATLKHTFFNQGFEQINAAKHLEEIIENAILTHAESITHKNENATAIYTLFGAVQTENGIQPIKLKVKEYKVGAQRLPEIIQHYFDANGIQDPYASAYDSRVLELESIEKEETSSSAMPTLAENTAQGDYPSVSSTIRVADLYNLVNTEYRKYLPPQTRGNTDGTPPGAFAPPPSKMGADGHGAGNVNTAQNKISGSESLNDIMKRNREQSRTIAKLRRQVRSLEDGVLTDPKQVKALTRSLLDDYSSSMSRDERTRVAAELQQIFDDIANNTTRDGDIQERIRSIAQEIVESSAVLNTETEEMYKTLKGYLKKNKLTLSEQDRADIPDFNDFRRSFFGTLKIGNNGIPVDTAYMELTEMLGEGIFPSDITHPADQLIHMKEMVQALKPVFENPNSRSMGEAARGLADEIYERFFDLSERPTRGREQQRQIDRIRVQANERVKAAIERERYKRDEKINKIMARHEAQTWERKQRITQNELRRKITQHAGKLSTILLKPTDTRHIVENGRQTEDGGTVSMRKTVAALLETINLESQYSVDPETGRRIYTGETEGQLTARTEKFRELRAMYQAVKNNTDSTMVVDPDLLYNLEELEELKDVKLNGYTTEQLYTLWNTIRAVESSLTSENKLFSQLRCKDIQTAAEQLIDDNRTDKPRDSGRGTDAQGLQKALYNTEDFLEVEMLTPYHYFRELGGSGSAIFSELSRARGQYITDTEWSMRYLEELKGDIDTSKWSGAKAELIPFETMSGQSGHMTRAQRLSLFLLSKRKQGLKHLTDKNGGIMMHEKGTETAERIILTKGDIERICADMSPEERKIAKGLSTAMEHFAKWGNESSMKLYGYEKFGEKNYFPIRTERGYRNTEKEKAAPGEKGYRIKNAGMTKSTDPGATNPIVLENAFDVFGRHAHEMANYHAFAPVLTDIDRIYNYQQWNKGERGQSVKLTIKNRLGKAGAQYWEQLINDINSGIQRERTPFSGMFSNFKAAKVGANLRVVFQQPLSYIRAGHMIDAKYLWEGLHGETDTDTMYKYAPIARWKALGYSEMDTGRQLSDMLSGKEETFLEKAREAAMWMPGKADEITWKALWRAVEAETRDLTERGHTELKPGTDAFYTAVGERFTEIIDRTQVVDTVLNRSGAMRNGGYGHQLGTMFMAEPTLDYNEIMASARDIKAGKQGAVGRAVRGAKYLTISAIAKALVCSLVDAGRDKDEDETWTQKFWQALIGLDGTEESLAEAVKHITSGNLAEGFNPLTWVPFVKDVVSLAQGYERKSPDTALLADFIKSVKRLHDAVNGKGKTALPVAVVQVLAKTADLSGLPLSNFEREVESAVNNILLMPLVKNSAAGQQAKFTFRRFHTQLSRENIQDWVKWGNRNLTNEGVLENFKAFLARNELATERDFRVAEESGREKQLTDLIGAWKEETRRGNVSEADRLAKEMDSLGYSDKKVQARLSAAEQALLKETWAYREKQSAHHVRITDSAQKSRQYKALSTEQQETFAARVRQYTGALALSEVDKSRKLEDFHTKWYAKARDAKTVGLSETQFLVMWTKTADIEPLRDKEGKPIPNSRGLRIMQEVYRTFPGLTNEQYIYLFDARNVPQKAMYTGDSKKHINNPARTDQLLAKLKRKEGK